MKEGSNPIRDMIAESGLDAAEYADVAEALAALRSAVPTEAPAPSPELAGLLGGGVVTQLRPRKHTTAVATGVAGALILLGGVAAASNNLPDPLQRFAHDVSHKVLPFEFPAPEGHAEGRDGLVQLPEQAKNDTDQGNHVGRGNGGGKTGNLGEHKGEENGAGTPDPSDNAGRPTDRPNKPDHANSSTEHSGNNANENGQAPGSNNGDEHGKGKGTNSAVTPTPTPGAGDDDGDGSTTSENQKTTGPGTGGGNTKGKGSGQGSSAQG